MSVYVKPCAKCRRSGREKTTPARKRKACPDCRWIAIAPPSMRRRSLGAFLTKEDAERAERDALSAKDRGVDLSPRKVTVEQLVERFIADRRSKQRALRTIDRYEGLAELSMLPHLGSLPIAKLTPAHVSAWLATLQEKGGARVAKLNRKPVLRDGKRVVEFTGKPLSAKTTKHAYALLRSALRWAVRHDLAARNVAEAVDPPTVGRSQAHALAEDDVRRLLVAADEMRWGPFFRVALGTAARRGELCALRWSDVDLDGATMTIARAVVETSGPKRGARLVEKTTKTDRVRIVPLGALALDALRAQRRMQAADRLRVGASFQDSAHVFQGPLGGGLVPYLATDAFRSLRTRLKIDASLHDLRHTAATWMLAGGIDVKTVAAVLGHSAASTTLNVYGHVIAGAQAKAVAAIDDRFRNVSA